MRSENVNELMAALSKAQGEIKNPPTTRTVTIKTEKGSGYTYNYAELHAVYDALKKPFADNGLAYTHMIEDDRGAMVLTTLIFHNSGQYIGSVYPLPRNGDPKGFAGAVTYGKRCTIAALAGLAGEEDKDAEPENEVAPEPRRNWTNDRGPARAPAPKAAAGGAPASAASSPVRPEGSTPPPAADPSKKAVELSPRQLELKEVMSKRGWKGAEVLAYIKTVFRTDAADLLVEGQYQSLLDVISTMSFTDAMNDFKLRQAATAKAATAAKPKEEPKAAANTDPAPAPAPEPSLGKQILERHVDPSLPSPELDPLNLPDPYPNGFSEDLGPEPGSEG